MGQKAVKVAAGVGGLVVAGWLAAGAMASGRAEEALKALQSAPKTPGSHFRITQLQHERGMLSSKGSAEIALEQGCEAESGSDHPVTLKVDYTMSHLPLPNSVTRFEWQASPTGEAAKGFKEVFGSASALTGSGAVALSGALRTDMALPEVSMRRAGEALEIAPSKGFLSVNGKALGFGWNVDRMIVRGNGQAVEVKQLAIDMDLHNRYLGTGSTQFSAGHVSAGFGSMDRVAFKVDAKESGDRLDMSFSPSIGNIEAQGKTISGLALEMALKGMDTRSVETLSTLFSASCGLKSMTADEGKRAKEAANTLLTKGFSMGISRIAGKSDDGSVDGRLMVELSPAKGQTLALAEQLKSDGEITLTGKIIPQDKRDLAVNMGFATARADGVRASFDYAGGVLKVNGRTLDGGQVLTALQDLDNKVLTALAGWGDQTLAKNDAPAAATPAPEVPVAMTERPPAEAPTAPTGGDCAALEDCFRQTLSAARKEDLETLRRLAGRIEGLPKPDLGNRAIARQLNTAALDALKRDDAASAVQSLRQAVKENPRDVEVVGNLGYALVKAGQATEAVTVLRNALVLDPRRSSTWTPLSEALALSGRQEDAKLALWTSFQWSTNREKSLAYYRDRATKEVQPSLQALYAHMADVAAAAMPAAPTAAASALR